MISVIMPAYNTDKYIKASIESVLRQTYADFELIIVDDGSTDQTGAILAEYQEKDKRIHVVHQKNQGVSAARNRGIELAQGEYISFLDSDDLWEPEFLHTLEQAIRDCKGNFVYSQPDMISPDGTVSVGSMACEEGKLNAFIMPWNELRIPFNMCSFLMKKSILDEYGIRFDHGLEISEDIGFFMKVLSVTKAYHRGTGLMHYIKHSNSATTKEWTAERWESVILIHEFAEPYVRKYHPEGLAVFERMRDYRTYRFVLGVVKHCPAEEAMVYITRWQKNLQGFVSGKGKPNDRLKCWLLLKRRKWLVRLLGRI